jgi:hypothetical protein
MMYFRHPFPSQGRVEYVTQLLYAYDRVALTHETIGGTWFMTSCPDGLSVFSTLSPSKYIDSTSKWLQLAPTMLNDLLL